MTTHRDCNANCKLSLLVGTGLGDSQTSAHQHKKSALCVGAVTDMNSEHGIRSPLCGAPSMQTNYTVLAQRPAIQWTPHWSVGLPFVAGATLSWGHRSAYCAMIIGIERVAVRLFGVLECNQINPLSEWDEAACCFAVYKKQRIAFQKIYRVWFGIRLASAQQKRSRDAAFASFRWGEGRGRSRTIPTHTKQPPNTRADPNVRKRLPCCSPACAPTSGLPACPNVNSRETACGPMCGHSQLRLRNRACSSSQQWQLPRRTGQCCFSKYDLGFGSACVPCCFVRWRGCKM